MTLPSLPLLGAIWGLSELGVVFVKRAKADATSEDRHSLQLILLVDVVSIVLGVWAVYRLPALTFPARPLSDAFSFGLFVAGLILRWVAILYLGRFFTTNVAIVADQRVVDSGPYRLIRHPAYAGGMLTFLGLALGFKNWAALVIIIVPVFGAFLWRIRIEEAALLKALGEPYRQYSQRTKRLIPGIY